MAQVAEKVLAWLYSVLHEYQDRQRTYSDAARTLSAYPSLSPRTEVYTHENGSSALLLTLSGTLPAAFRGTIYRFPVKLWIPQSYPQDPPLVYLSPSRDMLIRPGQHVGVDGRVYHPYLRDWARMWDRASITDLLEYLQDVFAKEPPVISKVHQRQYYNRPVPHTPHPQTAPGASPMPPRLPPKPRVGGVEPVEMPSRRTPPPKPPKQGGEYAPTYPRSPVSPVNGYAALAEKRYSQATPLPPLQYPLQYQYYPQTPQQPDATHAQQQPLSRQTPRQHHQQQPTQPQSYPPGQYYMAQPQQQPPPQQLQKGPPLDLLSDPSDVTLPGPNVQGLPVSAPPIPPNPEKEHLLHALSQLLAQQAQAKVNQNLSAVAPLQAQQTALRSAHQRLEAEIRQLEALSQTLDSNEAILRRLIADCDHLIQSTRSKPQPNIDEVLIAPTVVAKQLWECCAEEAACREAMYILQKAVDRGRVSGQDFVRQMRALGRETFGKMVLARKCAAGLGLDMGGKGAHVGY